MQRIKDWNLRQVGDIFLYAGMAELSRLIIDAEKIINPPTGSHSWVPSHAGIVGPRGEQVTEAWLDFEESSAAAVHLAAKYLGEMELGRLQLWRPKAGNGGAVQRIVQKLGPKPYGVGAIIGFEWVVGEELLFGHATDNPIKHATVCSMTVLTYLRDPTVLEPWAIPINEPDCSPDVLLRNIEANAAS